MPKPTWQPSIDSKASHEARGIRLARLRGSLRLSRTAFFKKFGISPSTLQNWEDNKSGGLSEKGANRIIQVLKSAGINCTFEWLMYGVEPAPTLMDTSLGQILQDESILPTSFEDDDELPKIAQELRLFRENYQHQTIDMVVPDDGMEPIYSLGEYVAGIKYFPENFSKIVGQNCIIQTEEGEILLRHVKKLTSEEYFRLICINPDTTIEKPIIYNVKLLFAAPVIWSRCKHL